MTSGSDQAVPRHSAMLAECCFLPDLTRFAVRRCAGPGPQRHASGGVRERRPREGIQHCYSGLQVQGTASSPPSTAPKGYRGWVLPTPGPVFPAGPPVVAEMDERRLEPAGAVERLIVGVAVRCAAPTLE